MKTITFVAAFAATVFGSAAMADPERQVQVGSDIFMVDASTLCGQNGEMINGHQIRVFTNTGHMWIGQRGGAIAKLGLVCSRSYSQASGGGGGNVTLQQSQDASGALDPGETQEQDEDDGLDDSDNNTGIAAISG